MKKLEISEGVSHLLLFSSVGLALMPFLLRDQLFLIVTGGLREGSVMVDQLFNYVTTLLS